MRAEHSGTNGYKRDPAPGARARAQRSDSELVGSPVVIVPQEARSSLPQRQRLEQGRQCPPMLRGGVLHAGQARADKITFAEAIRRSPTPPISFEGLSDVLD